MPPSGPILIPAVGQGARPGRPVDRGGACPAEDPDSRAAGNPGRLASDGNPQRRTALAQAFDPLEPGTTFGKFTVLRRLGGGGFGTTYQVFDRSLERHVVVKVGRPEVTATAHGREWFGKEAKALAKLRHTNVIGVYEIGKETVDGATYDYLVEEFFDGLDLRSRLRQFGPLSNEDAVKIMRQVLLGLSEAHSRNIVHGDIKVDNIVVNDPLDVRIVDFGIARIWERLETTSRLPKAGTLAYMAPEQHETGATVQTDLFQVGLLTLEAVTAKPPKKLVSTTTWNAKSEEEGAERLAHLTSVPEPLCSWIARLTAQEIEGRPRSATAALQLLESLELSASRSPSSSWFWVGLPLAFLLLLLGSVATVIGLIP